MGNAFNETLYSFNQTAASFNNDVSPTGTSDGSWVKRDEVTDTWTKRTE